MFWPYSGHSTIARPVDAFHARCNHTEEALFDLRCHVSPETSALIECMPHEQWLSYLYNGGEKSAVACKASLSRIGTL